MANALAYVSGAPKMVDGTLKYCYLLAVNLESLTKSDLLCNPIANPSTGKYTLLRDGMGLETLMNTTVHELFHALMDDYNRTGMVGALTLQDAYKLVNKTNPDDKASSLRLKLAFPMWFVEGSATAVENVYQYRYEEFQDLRRQQGDDFLFGTGDLSDRFTNTLILNNYLYAMDKSGNRVYYDIDMSGVMTDENGDQINSDPARYVTGYLATLYLCDLAVRSMNSGQSAITTTNGVTTVDSAKLREGLNSIIKRSHEGETLDSIVNSLSPTKDGKKIYANTNELSKKFIKGTWDASNQLDMSKIDQAIQNGEDPSKVVANEMDYADMDSLNFTTALLNYMLDLDTKLGTDKPNGSILRDYDENFTSPLDASKQTSSPYLKIIESNEGVESSVNGDEIVIGAGKSDPEGVVAEQGSSPKAADQQQVPEASGAPETPETPETPEASAAQQAAEATQASEATGAPQASEAPQASMDATEAPTSGDGDQTQESRAQESAPTT